MDSGSRSRAGVACSFGPTGADSFDDLKTLWLGAERLGYVSIWHGDNVYPHLSDAQGVKISAPIQSPAYDCWTTIAALASVTSTIRFGPLVTPAPRRHPALLAKAAASLDNISGGRLTIGMGGGDPTTVGMYSQWGQAFPVTGRERIALLKEHLQVQRLMYTQDFANFEGEHFRLQNAVNSPKPIQNPLPIWVGLNSRAGSMPRLAAEYADGVVVQWGNDEVAASVVRNLNEACEAIGRDASEITKARLVFVLITDGRMDDDAAYVEIAKASGVSKPDPTVMRVGFEEWSPVLVGTPDEIVEPLLERTVGLGYNHIVVNAAFGLGSGLDTGGLEGYEGLLHAGMSLFANEVIPKL
jgi:alkanesulfonate monooxygenase SsuD/methylene tetrahydromethanopterin reductase-like flavin-dependent oxidoreductase (luciferase family)